ncbi:MAG: dihydrodipicolinate synthase family protein [Burkholderiales bacterium]|nr:dihydrodipicolinate synthase family protein [Burkholderiales bacterium]
MTYRPIEGVCAFSVTPAQADGAIDMSAWKKHLERMVTAKVHSITLFGSTGSNGYYTEAEKVAALTLAVETVAGRVPLMFGVGAMTTAESARMAKLAGESGIDALLVVPLNYWTPTSEEIYAHYQAIAEATSVPLWIYNNPSLAGVDLTPSVIVSLSRLPNVVGMKESSGDLTRLVRIPSLTNGKVLVGIGQDTNILDAILGPSPAWFTGLANFAPELCVQYWEASKKGDVTAAWNIAKMLAPISEIGSRYGIVRVAHEAGSLMNLGLGLMRRPLLPLSTEGREELRVALMAIGLL